MEPKIENNILNRIPYDIIVKILSYLPATYRKQARLVSSKWYEASNDITILKHQKFKFHKYYKANLNFMLDILKKININYYNLEFEGDTDNACYGLKSLDEQFDSFIESHGSKIHSLRFRDCSVSFKTMEKIFIHCINLKELIFEKGDYYSNISPCIPIIDGVEIERRKLKILKFKDCGIWMMDQLLTIFISIYTQLEELVLYGVSMIHDNAKIDQYYKAGHINQPSCSIVSYRNFYQIASQKCQNIKKLTLAWPSDNGLTDDDLATLTTSFKLNELKLIDHGAISTESFKIFLSQQRNLIALDVSNCTHFNLECFKLLFDQNANLKYFKGTFQTFDPFPSIPVPVQVIRCLENSQLKSFYWHFNWHGALGIRSIGNGKLHTMNKLTFSTTTRPSTFFISMLELFHNITHLRLWCFDKIDEVELSFVIFNKMIHLETIRLYCCNKWISDNSFENSTGRLKNLQHLDLEDCNSLTTKGIKNFHYPKLRFLNLSESNLIDKQGFTHLVKNSPLLEDLTVNSLDEDTLQIICKNLKFLSRLKMKGDYQLATYAFHFQSCPSLRCVEIDAKNTYYFFTYNPVTGCLNKGITAEDEDAYED